ncbi:MAG: hypothetical protein SOZ07_07805, partial [Prevotella sp.]|nr:hypothetical protein [Prevotellaceae bacterium]MDY3936535.1 hypothetical protein [Prevotella sp.]
ILLYLSLSYKNFLTWQSPGLGKSGLCLYFSAVLYVKREAAPILTQPQSEKQSTDFLNLKT